MKAQITDVRPRPGMVEIHILITNETSGRTWTKYYTTSSVAELTEARLKIRIEKDIKNDLGIDDTMKAALKLKGKVINLDIPEDVKNGKMDSKPK